MERKILEQMNSMDKAVPAHMLEGFQYFSNILHRHAQQLKESTRAICKLAERSVRESSEPQTESKTSRSEVPANFDSVLRQHKSNSEMEEIIGSCSSDGTCTPKALLEDYKDLHIRCMDLSKMCAQGINLAMGKAPVQESGKAIEQSERLKKLTVLATLFIPLSFCASLFGMNIDLLGQSSVKVWWFFVLCIPVTLLAYFLHRLDFRVAKRWLATLRTECYEFVQSRAAKRGRKPTDHMV